MKPTTDAALSAGVPHAPTINGYVETAPKETATSEFVVGDRSAPLLARWSYGLGRAVSFTSTVGAAWDKGFWRGGGERLFWERVVRWAARPAATPGFEARLAQRDDRWELTVRAERQGRLVNGLDLVARVDPPGAEPFDTPLPQTAPGEYRATFPAARKGVHRITVFERGGRQVLFLAAAKNYGREWAAFGVDDGSLAEIARSGGGEVLTDLAALEKLPVARASGWRDAAWLPTSLALVVFVAEVALSLVRSRKQRL